MEYKVGDKVRIKSIDWYNENKDEYGNIDCGDYLMIFEKSQFCGKIVTISSISDVTDSYKIEEDNGRDNWTDEMIEGLVEEKCDYVQADNTPDVIQAKTASACSHNGFYGYSDSEGNETSEWYLPDGYQFVDENGNVINATKIVLGKKKPKYPQTYEECCKVLGVNPYNYLTIRNVHCYDGEEERTKYERDLLGKFDFLWKLRICRDAYWKIAGEKMGLGEPWQPDWNSLEPKHVISISKNSVKLIWEQYYHRVFAFPTEEMRDAFYKAFEKEIEECKELI